MMRPTPIPTSAIAIVRTSLFGGRTSARLAATPASIVALVGRIITVNPARRPKVNQAAMSGRIATEFSRSDAIANASAAIVVTASVGTSLNTSVEYVRNTGERLSTIAAHTALVR